MLSELTKKGILAIKGLLDECKAGIEQTNKELEVIDEKYRKMIAEEKKTLKGNLAEYKAQMKQYEKMFGTFDATAVKEVLGDFESTATEEPDETVESTPTAEEEETVFDTVYPENNAKEEEEEKENEDEKELVPVLAEEKKDLDTEEDAEWEEKIESGELVEVAPKKEVPVLETSEDGWPEFPEDWK